MCGGGAYDDALDGAGCREAYDDAFDIRGGCNVVASVRSDEDKEALFAAMTSCVVGAAFVVAVLVPGAVNGAENGCSDEDDPVGC